MILATSGIGTACAFLGVTGTVLRITDGTAASHFIMETAGWGGLSGMLLLTAIFALA